MGELASQAEGARRHLALAAHLAAFARRLCALVQADLAGDGPARLAALYGQAREEVAPELSREAFADLLAQALVYSLLLVRSSSQERREPFARSLRAFLTLPG